MTIGDGIAIAGGTLSMALITCVVLFIVSFAKGWLQ